MSQPYIHTFQFGDGGSHNAGVSETSIALKMCFNHPWVLIPVSSGLDASPVYTIETSIDGVNFAPYAPETFEAAIDQPFDDTHSTGIYWRIVYDKKTNTTGTVSFTIALK